MQSYNLLVEISSQHLKIPTECQSSMNPYTTVAIKTNKSSQKESIYDQDSASVELMHENILNVSSDVSTNTNDDEDYWLEIDDDEGSGFEETTKLPLNSRSVTLEQTINLKHISNNALILKTKLLHSFLLVTIVSISKLNFL